MSNVSHFNCFLLYLSSPSVTILILLDAFSLLTHLLDNLFRIVNAQIMPRDNLRSHSVGDLTYVCHWYKTYVVSICVLILQEIHLVFEVLVWSSILIDIFHVCKWKWLRRALEWPSRFIYLFNKSPLRSSAININ